MYRIAFLKLFNKSHVCEHNRNYCMFNVRWLHLYLKHLFLITTITQNSFLFSSVFDIWNHGFLLSYFFPLSNVHCTVLLFRNFLKGHGNEADFLGFLQKLGPHRSLTLPFEPFRFWLRSRGDIRNRKTTPRLAESRSRRLSDSVSRGVADSPTRRVGESTTQRLAQSGSQLLNV